MAANGTTYRIRRVAGQGQAMFAERDIQRGELIENEEPLVQLSGGPKSLYDPNTFFLPNGAGAGQREFDHISTDFGQPRTRHFRALHNAHPALGNFGIVQTNAFEREVEYGAIKHIVLYVCRFISRVNHSCRPNAIVYYDDANQTAVLRATEAIAFANEIFIDYMPNDSDFLQPKTIRRARLQQAYGFLCACPACQLTLAPLQQQTTLKRATRALAEVIEDTHALGGLVNPIDLSQLCHGHRQNDIRNFDTLINNLKTLGAQDDKLLIAYLRLAEYHSDNADGAAHANNTLAVCPTRNFAIHPKIHLARAIEAQDMAFTLAVRLEGEDGIQARAMYPKLQGYLALKTKLLTSPR